ncbi:MAG TPA: hypothetical protein VI731_12090 [Bacteroidia bacterium]|nr:hypothetical protein [Bacteroidia bacterium]
MKTSFGLLFYFLLSLSAYGQAGKETDKPLMALEDSMKKMEPVLFKGKDQVKFRANEKFIATMRQALSLEGSFDYPFDSLKFIGRLTSPDEAFRIFNWNIPKEDGTYMYYGFLLVNESKLKGINRRQKRTFVLYDLVDKSAEIQNAELATLSTEKWYGALYYKIIRTNNKKEDYYTLLGWDGNNHLTWKKMIDVLTFAKDGKPVFGEKNLFHKGKRSSKRVIFEFRADLVMTLRYEDNNKRIVFDHLAPEIAGAEGIYQFYSQTFSYDAYYWKKGKWVLENDVDVANPKTPNDNKYIDPKGSKRPTEAGAPSNEKKKKLFRRKKTTPVLSGAG